LPPGCEQVTLKLEVEKRDKDFVAALSEREQSLRSTAPLDRARAASGLRKLDLNVDSLRRALVVVTLQLQVCVVCMRDSHTGPRSMAPGAFPGGWHYARARGWASDRFTATPSS